MTALRERIGAQILTPIETEIKELETELVLLRKVQALFLNGGGQTPVKRPPVRRRKKAVAKQVPKQVAKRTAAVPAGDVAAEITKLMGRNGKTDFSVAELAKQLRVKRDRVARGVTRLVRDGSLVEAGMRTRGPGVRGGRGARTYALTKKR